MKGYYKHTGPFIIFLLFTFHLIAQQDAKKMFSILPSATTGINFRNLLVENEKLFYYQYESLYNGGGVAVGDVNNDGLQDIYFSSNIGSNKLYLNTGNLQFRDITEQAGVAAMGGFKTGVNMIDINNDGYLDIMVCRSGPMDARERKNSLFINNRNGSFTDRAPEYGLADESYTNQAYFLDYDRDGDMDVYLLNQPRDFTTSMLINSKMENGKQVIIKDTVSVHVSDRLYENRNGRFTDVTKKVGLLNHAFGLSVSLFDFNNDGWQDIYVANDMKDPDFLYINNRNGTFTERLSDYFNHISFFSMGSDINDINNDGYEDLFVLDMAIEDPVRQKQLFMHNLNYDKFQLMYRFGLFYQHARNVLQLNNGDGSFSEIANYAGIAQTDWSWTPLIADYDNDGWKDIFVTNGYLRDITDWDYKMFVLDSIKNLMAKGISVNLAEWFRQIPQTRIKNYFYHNNGSLRFDNYSDTWCDQPPSFSNSAVYADLDNDGDLDLVVNNMIDEAFIYRNNARELNNAHYLRFRLFKNPGSAEEGYGTIVKLYNQNDKLQMQHYNPQRGYLGSVEHFLHFGLGNEMTAKKIEIIFPSGKQVVLNNVNVDRVLTIYESDAVAPIPAEEKKPILFSELTAKNNFAYLHKENDFIDFKREPLIPYKCSRKGPYYAMADVNGDNREDIFIGGASGFEGKLMIQTPQRTFVEKKQSVFTADKSFEDAGVLFFDADGDNDNDIYVVSGGAQFEARSAHYQDRLYINDGKGNFTKAVNSLPKEGYNGSYVISLDFDGDEDLDLFVGGAVFPGKFPLHDRNMLLKNNNGSFKNVIDLIAPGLNNTGIINYAVWEDIDGDKKNELIITGEWMPMMIFKMDDGKFEKMNATVRIKQQAKEITVNLDELSGWWSSLNMDDIDNDGDMDILLGNRGLNSKITATLEEPCLVYAKDFDNNGSYDAVLGYYIWGKPYPMYHRDQLIDQMPSMRKKFIRYRHYAGTTLDEIFTNEQKKDMQVFKTACFESGVLLNDGNNSFRFEAFPDKAQFSNINDMLVDDFDKDGIKDVLVCGNSYDPDVSTGNYDAMAVLLLKGIGNGNFIPVPQLTSGLLKIKGEVRRMIYLKRTGGQENPQVIFLKNGSDSQVFLIR